ncbi:MAG: A/G-specific adenine glycosylase [Burkholderiaceae bacterium]|nr:MAG: A/G-specific adenine glycosylase [Burkholderiaceae bacterium]
MERIIHKGIVAPWQPGEFAERVAAWQRRHGRHDLPWQGTRDPYHVWLSEIMLQQTQVQTVLAYYTRFVARFPTVQALAAAPLDDVLSLWSGLGYYARARHVHECAQVVANRYGGSFPRRADELERLPGIGKSTAAAIAAFCFDERAAILDGNVKRVLTRVFGLEGDLGRAVAQHALWQRAHGLLPPDSARESMPAYTQGLMDLGATICLRHAPRCAECPLADRCVAAVEGDPERYPRPRVRAAPRALSWWLLNAIDPAGRSWLVRRPAAGIWARLYCLPVFARRADLLAALPEALRAHAVDVARFKHGLTHRILDLCVVEVRFPAGMAPKSVGAWFDKAAWSELGLPAPVRRYLADQDNLFTPRPARGAA